MCTKEEAKEAIVEVLYEQDAEGETIISKQINEHITKKGNEIIAKITMRFGVAFVGLFMTGAGTWYALYYQVQQNTRALEETDAYTQQEATQRNEEVQRQFAEQNEKIVQLRTDMSNTVSTIQSDIREIRNLLLRAQ